MQQPPYGYGPPAGDYGGPVYGGQQGYAQPFGNAYPAMQPCMRCGQPGPDYFMPPNPPAHRACMGLGPDTLSGGWIALAYLVTIPLGCSLIGALLASIPYYMWRRDYPNKARAYNRHVWIAFAISFMFWVGLSTLSKL